MKHFVKKESPPQRISQVQTPLGSVAQKIEKYYPKPADPGCFCDGGCPRCLSVQPKLKMGMPHDRYEQEADRIAEKVDNRGRPQSFGVSENLHAVQNNTRFIHSFDSQSGRENDISAIDVIKFGGEALPKSVSDYFGLRFGQDLSHVRIHNDSAAHRASDAINARAFTTGNHIVFGQGQYQPDTREGKQLLAHELTHVMQQGAGRQMSTEHVQAMFEDEPISEGDNADILKTRCQGILREWKSECQEGVNDFVFSELASQIDDLSSGSWTSFFSALVGNTIWAASAFLPGVGALATGASALARATFAMSMGGIMVGAAGSIPSPSSEASNLLVISDMMKTYFGNVFTELFNSLDGLVRSYVDENPTQNGRNALLAFLNSNFKPEMINTTGEPNVNGNAIRQITRQKAARLLEHLPTLFGASGINFVPGESVSPLGAAGMAAINSRIDDAIAEHAREILEFQSAHPSAGVLVEILMRASSNWGPMGNQVVRQFRSCYPIMDTRFTDRETAIRITESQTTIEAMPPEGWWNYTTYHWIPPLGSD